MHLKHEHIQNCIIYHIYMILDVTILSLSAHSDYTSCGKMSKREPTLPYPLYKLSTKVF